MALGHLIVVPADPKVTLPRSMIEVAHFGFWAFFARVLPFEPVSSERPSDTDRQFLWTEL